MDYIHDCIIHLAVYTDYYFNIRIHIAMITIYLSVLIEVLAIIGLGNLFLLLCRTDNFDCIWQRISISFAIGTGLLGWLFFWLGIVSELTKLNILILLLVSSVFSISAVNKISFKIKYDIHTMILYFILLSIVIVGILVSHAPPVDADSLAYHFAIPQEFNNNQRIAFIPRAIDGAVPLLIQLTYLPSLAIGGEKSMIIMAYTQAVFVLMFIYSFARQYLSSTYSLAITIVIASTPGVIPNSMSGQVEIRIVLFVMLSLWGIRKAINAKSDGEIIKFIIISGIGAGFYAASKYIGLFFILSVGIVILIYRRKFSYIFAFSLACFLSGFQWYFWNWLNSGDPFFPMLFGKIAYNSELIWNKGQHELFLRYRYGYAEIPENISLWLWLSYPIKATLFGHSEWESGKTGLGLFPLLLAPFAFYRFVISLKSNKHSDILSYIVVITVFYTLMIFWGSTQRVRHFIPILPIVTILLVVYAQEFPKLLAASLIVVLSIQLSVLSLFSFSSIRYTITNQPREDFLERNVPNYKSVQEINRILGGTPDVKLLHYQRYLTYYLGVSNFFFHGYAQAIIPSYERSPDPKYFWNSLKAENITHILVTEDQTNADKRYKELLGRELVSEISRWHIRGLSSRTLSQPGGDNTAILYKINRDKKFLP